MQRVEVSQTENNLSFNGIVMPLPCVEKPFDADDHNINIYYGKGGGVRKLFRKVKNKSSEHFPGEYEIRMNGDFIYEQLLEGGMDLKVYTVGPDYAHGETRKSPVIDGIVERDPDSKELRLPTPLTPNEHDIARKIVYLFRQNICGFDFIRWNGGSYVIDVNGWSFVKGNLRYYDKCARFIRQLCLGSKIGRNVMALKSTKGPLPPGFSLHPHHRGLRIHDPPPSSLSSSEALPPERKPSRVFVSGYNHDVLRALVCVFRHADRTPKQKVKLDTSDPRILQFFTNDSERKMKKDSDFVALLGSCKAMLHDEENSDVISELPSIFKSTSLSSADLSLKIGSIIPPSSEIATPVVTSEASISPYMQHSEVSTPSTPRYKLPSKYLSKLQQIITVLSQRYGGLKVQLKPLKIVDGRVVNCQIVCKWGGELTHAGTEQTIQYVPVFWDEMLRPECPAPPTSTDDPAPRRQTTRQPTAVDQSDATITDAPLTCTQNVPSAAPVIASAVWQLGSLKLQVDDGAETVSHPDIPAIPDVEDAQALKQFDDPAYKRARRAFLRGMCVFAADESRVKATARTFVQTTLDGENLPPDLVQETDEVQEFLDDTRMAKDSMEAAKRIVHQLVTSNEPTVEDEDEKSKKKKDRAAKKSLVHSFSGCAEQSEIQQPTNLEGSEISQLFQLPAPLNVDATFASESPKTIIFANSAEQLPCRSDTTTRTVSGIPDLLTSSCSPSALPQCHAQQPSESEDHFVAAAQPLPPLTAQPSVRRPVVAHWGDDGEISVSSMASNDIDETLPLTSLER